MTLHVSDIRPPSDEQIAHARVVDAALAEAGWPEACVSVTDQGTGVSCSMEPYRAGPPQHVIKRAFDVARSLNG